MTTLLRVASIETLYFDRIYALFGLSLEIAEGEMERLRRRKSDTVPQT